MQCSEERVLIACGAKRVFATNGLAVDAELVGSSHCFEHEGKFIIIEIPMSSDDGSSDDISGNYKNTDGSIFAYTVNRVHLTLKCPENLEISRSSIGKRRVIDFSDLDANRIASRMSEYIDITQAAFENWKKFVAWKSKRYSYFQDKKSDFDRFLGLDMYDFDNCTKFYARGGGVIRSTYHQALTAGQWVDIQSAIRSRDNVPLWQSLLIDSQMKKSLNDLKGSMLEMAVAIEIHTRKLVTDILIPDAPIGIKSKVSRIPISQIFSDWYEIGFSKNYWGRLSGELKLIRKIIDLRNKIAHNGKYSKGIDPNDALYATVSFFSYGENILEANNKLD